MTITTEEVLAAIPEDERAALDAGLSEIAGPFAQLERDFDIGPRYFGFQGEPISFPMWAMLFQSPLRQIARTEIGPYFVSTVWLGLDHGFGRSEEPIIFETMVFEKELRYREPHEAEGRWPSFPGFHYHEDFDQRRYSTQEAAIEDHEKIVNEIPPLGRGESRLAHRERGLSATRHSGGMMSKRTYQPDPKPVKKEKEPKVLKRSGPIKQRPKQDRRKET